MRGQLWQPTRTGTDCPLPADVRLDLVQRGRKLYFPRGEIPLDKSMDRGFVGHQVSDLSTVCSQLEARLQRQFEQQLAAVESTFQTQLAANESSSQSQLDLIHSITTVPYVRNVAAQCLNQALGKTGNPHLARLRDGDGHPG